MEKFRRLAAKYEVQPLSRGGQGACWLLTRGAESRVVKECQDLRDLVREVTYLSQVKAINGVQHIAGVCGEKQLLITDFAGMSLDDYLDKGDQIDLAFLLTLANKLAHTVSQVNALNIYHNDIKLSNICVRKSSAGVSVRLIDFGLASSSEPLELDEPLSDGTCTWMAPEVKQGQCSSPASDAYGVAHVLLTLFRRTHVAMPTPLHKWAKAALIIDPRYRPALDQLLACLAHVKGH